MKSVPIRIGKIEGSEIPSSPPKCSVNAVCSLEYRISVKLFEPKDIQALHDFFKVMATTKQSQIAGMVLEKGQVSGEYGNEHPESDQILIVLEGEGTARIEAKELKLGCGSVVLIEAGEKHQIKSGSGKLRTLNLYAPPAYGEDE